jgi:hypothetical protein
MKEYCHRNLDLAECMEKIEDEHPVKGCRLFGSQGRSKTGLDLSGNRRLYEKKDSFRCCSHGFDQSFLNEDLTMKGPPVQVRPRRDMLSGNVGG